MTRSYLEHGSGRDTLVDYVSSEGERVKVVSGNYNLSGSGRGKKKKFFQQVKHSTRVWINGQLELEIDQSELPYDEIPIVRYRLEELEYAEAPSDEIVSAILNSSAQYRYREAMRELDSDFIESFQGSYSSDQEEVDRNQELFWGFQIKNKTRKKQREIKR